MLILYGTRGFQREGGFIADNSPCPVCGCADNHTVRRVRQWFTLYYIPIFPFSTKYFRHCPQCGWDEEDKSLKRAFIEGRRALRGAAQPALPAGGQPVHTQSRQDNPVALYGRQANAVRPEGAQAQGDAPRVTAPVDPSTAYARALGYDPDKRAR